VALIHVAAIAMTTNNIMQTLMLNKHAAFSSLAITFTQNRRALGKSEKGARKDTIMIFDRFREVAMFLAADVSEIYL
jgi:hypothetical protein